MIHVVAIITAKPGQRAAVLKHFAANVPAVLPRPAASNTARRSTSRTWARPPTGRTRSW